MRRSIRISRGKREMKTTLVTKKIVLLLGTLALSASLLAMPAARGQDNRQTAPDNTKMNKDHTSPTADQQKMNASDRATTQQIRKAIHDDANLSTYAHNIK